MTSYLFNRIVFPFVALSLLFHPSICLSMDKQEKSSIPLKALLTPFISFGPFFIAEEEGYFTEQGLVVNFVKFDDASKAIPSLLKGDIDIIGGTISVSMLNAMAKGGRMRLVADKAYISATGCDHFALLARKNLIKDGEILDPVHLKGKRIAVKLARSTEYFFEKILGRTGLTMGDIIVFNIPDEVMLEAFKNKGIDFAVTSEPWITHVIDTGQGAVWIPAKQVIPDFPIGIVLYGPNLIEKYSTAGKKFMVAYLKAVRQYNGGKTKRNVDILNKHTGLTHEFLNRACWAPIRDDGQIHIESIVDFQSWALKKGFLDKRVSPNQFWDPSFIEYANKILTGSTK